jgi:hypothetical protein
MGARDDNAPQTRSLPVRGDTGKIIGRPRHDTEAARFGSVTRFSSTVLFVVGTSAGDRRSERLRWSLFSLSYAAVPNAAEGGPRVAASKAWTMPDNRNGAFRRQVRSPTFKGVKNLDSRYP